MVKKRKKLHEFRNPLRMIIFSKKKKKSITITQDTAMYFYIKTSYLQKTRSAKEPDGVNHDIYVAEGF